MGELLICFDIDGTLDCKENDNEEYLKGIIPEKLLVKLWKDGNHIAIVSPSPYFPDKWKGDDHWFKEYGSNSYRWKNVFDAMKYYRMNSYNTIYVDDLESNRMQLEKLDIVAFTPEDFISVFGE